MNIICIAAWIAALLTIPFLLLYLATESREQRIRRWHGRGMSQRAIAERLGVSRYRVRQALP
jgi:DNA-binding GntR family transcriptional regulator